MWFNKDKEKEKQEMINPPKKAFISWEVKLLPKEIWDEVDRKTAIEEVEFVALNWDEEQPNFPIHKGPVYRLNTILGNLWIYKKRRENE